MIFCFLILSLIPWVEGSMPSQIALFMHKRTWFQFLFAKILNVAHVCAHNHDFGMHALSDLVQYFLMYCVNDWYFLFCYFTAYSLENHCSIPTQNRMANYLVSILGDSLAIPNLEEANPFLSPESLKHKVEIIMMLFFFLPIFYSRAIKRRVRVL